LTLSNIVNVVLVVVVVMGGIAVGNGVADTGRPNDTTDGTLDAIGSVAAVVVGSMLDVSCFEAPNLIGSTCMGFEIACCGCANPNLTTIHSYLFQHNKHD
jgi:hypothetical protein